MVSKENKVDVLCSKKKDLVTFWGNVLVSHEFSMVQGNSKQNNQSKICCKIMKKLSVPAI